MNKSKATIYVGETVTLKLKNNKKKVKWSSSNKKVAAVSKKGKVKGKKAGKATITAKVGKKKYNCKITVKKEPAPIKPDIVQQPTAKPDAVQQPTTKSGIVQQPTTKPSVEEQTTTKEPATEEQPTTKEPATEEQPTTKEPATEEPTTKEPTTEEPTTEEPTTSVSAEVKWNVTAEKFTKAYPEKNEITGEPETKYAELTREYVSFAPWPTTNEQVEYVIKNCDDPYVIGALYVVALDNYEYNGLGKYDGVVYKMLETLMNGAGTVKGTQYQLSNYAKQQICGFGSKQIFTPSGAINVSTFASRAYLKGATPYNGYTPEGGLEDKTKWQIMMDERIYNGDIANGYITVCPQRYSEKQDTETGPKEHIEHWDGLCIGMRYNKTAGIWLPTETTALSTPPTGALVPFNVESQVLFSSNYIPPEEDQGF